jgi:hypothetical protein
VTAALFHGIPSAEEFPEFLHSTAAFVQTWYSKSEVKCHTKSQSVDNMEGLQVRASSYNTNKSTN